MAVAPAPVIAATASTPHSNIEGFIWSLVILGAARLGRKQAEDKFLDHDALRVSHSPQQIGLHMATHVTHCTT